MKRSGFTMIELIFVIVILGILAAVALPKFIGVSEQAKVGKLQGYVGTLNRTTLPPYWSESLLTGKQGAIGDYNAKIKLDLPAPDNITVSFAAANLLPSNYDFTADVTPGKTIGTKDYNGVTYSIACADGNLTSAARCDLYSGASNKYMINANY